MLSIAQLNLKIATLSFINPLFFLPEVHNIEHMYEADCVNVCVCKEHCHNQALRPSGRRGSLLRQQFNSVRDNSMSVNCQLSGRGRKSSFFPISVTHRNQECICRSHKEAQE